MSAKLVRLSLIATAALTLVGGASAVVAEPAAPGAGDGRHEARTLVIGHRGASANRPEHTLAAYELAARMGADYIEPDLVITKDGVLIARHEPEIGETTDVGGRAEFAARRTTKTVDGVAVTGWFAEDFTLAELKTLRAKERIPQLRQENTIFDGRYQVPTLQEVIDLSRRLGRELRREIGIYPETKHPTYFRKQGRPLEPRLVETLSRNGLNRPGAKVFVQSFEVSNLRELRGQLRVPLVQLVNATGAPFDFVDTGDPRTYDDLVTRAGLAEIARYAKGVGPHKDRIIPRDAGGFLTRPTTLVTDAHRAGLVVHPWTFRAENNFLPADFRSSADPAAYGNLFGELDAFLRTGIDGFFTDNPDIGVAARNERRAAA